MMDRKAPAKEGNLNSDFCDALIEPAQKVIRREPLHSTPAGSSPSFPGGSFSGVSPIPVLESEESLIDSSEEEREVSRWRAPVQIPRMM